MPTFTSDDRFQKFIAQDVVTLTFEKKPLVLGVAALCGLFGWAGVDAFFAYGYAISLGYAALGFAGGVGLLRFSLMVAGNPESSGYTTSVAHYEDGILSMRTSDIYRNSGEFLEKFGGSGSPAGARVFGVVQPLHCGTFGGYPIKAIYFILSLALTCITSSGMMIWFKRKKQQGDPKLRTEAWWRGMTTGLSLALAVTALATVAALPLPLTTLFLAVWIIAMVLVARSRNPIKVVSYTFVAISAVLIATGPIHLPSALQASDAAMPILMSIDVLLITTAAAFLLAAYRTRNQDRVTKKTASLALG